MDEGEKTTIKAIKHLSQSELVSLIYNTWDSTDVHNKLADCSCCGKIPNEEHNYICDECAKK